MGAIIGVILGGERGAAIGAVIGAGAGTAAQAMSKAAQVRLPADSTLSVRLKSPVTVIPSSTLIKAQNASSGLLAMEWAMDELVLQVARCRSLIKRSNQRACPLASIPSRTLKSCSLTLR